MPGCELAASALIHSFKTDISNIVPPAQFTYMFYYEPHELCKIAAAEVQEFLEEQKHWAPEFGLANDGNSNEYGKMIGVLVVKNERGELSYLASFSGNTNLEEARNYFVPMVYELPEGDNFFVREMVEIQRVAAELKRFKSSEELAAARKELAAVEDEANAAIAKARSKSKQAKALRAVKRKKYRETLSAADYENLLHELSMESQEMRYALKAVIAAEKKKVEAAAEVLKTLENRLKSLQKNRASRSAALQEKLFEKYRFLNKYGEEKSVGEIFDFTASPPSGAGDCAAPKLLQYAFLHGFIPVAMAEFWWGKSPVSTIRIHKKFYPACTNKCKSILAHMLAGMDVEPNPLEKIAREKRELERVYEDDDLVVVNKPAGMLSVPGKEIHDSVISRLEEQYDGKTLVLAVHRLDMSTSGLLLIAKSPQVHKILQEQFLEKTIYKRYVAVLEGYTTLDSGEINLPLRVDLNNRPSQMVCYEFGKEAITKFEVIRKKKGVTRVYLYPITGRTHQLRMHCAHSHGLGRPIKGDVLYGQKSDRLYLHAEVLEFNHPATGERVRVEVKAGF